MGGRCGDGGGEIWSGGMAVSVCAYSEVLSKLTFLYWVLKLNVMFPLMTSHPGEKINLPLCTGEHLPPGMLFCHWAQCSSSCGVKREWYTLHWRTFSLPLRFQPAVCNHSETCDHQTLLTQDTRHEVQSYCCGPMEQVSWLNDTICFCLPMGTQILVSGEAMSAFFPRRFSSHPWLKGESKVTSFTPSTTSAARLWAEGPVLLSKSH